MIRVNSSYDHHVYRIAADTLADMNARWARESGRASWRGRQEFLPHQPCSRRCDNAIEYIVTYRYVAGRRGGLSLAQKYVCGVHAARFALKYGLELESAPTVNDRLETAAEAAIRELTQ